jgi:hypothetical protein
MTTTTSTPPPSGATYVAEWQINGDTATRFFRGTERGETVSVDIGGYQNYDGTLHEAVIFVDGRGINSAELSADVARQLARDLLAAAVAVAISASRVILLVFIGVFRLVVALIGDERIGSRRHQPSWYDSLDTRKK